MISFQGVTKIYDDTDEKVLGDLDFHVENGGFLYLTGESGSGKSTIIKLLLRDIEATQGDIQVDGIHIADMKHKDVPRYRQQMGVIFQDFNLIGDQTVYQNVELAQQIKGVSKWSSKRQVLSVLSFLHMEEKYNRYPEELSGGEQQMVCLARALVNRPKYLLADEPTANLDPESAKALIKILEEINRRGTTVICATHNMELVHMFPHKTLHLRKRIEKQIFD